MGKVKALTQRRIRADHRTGEEVGTGYGTGRVGTGKGQGLESEEGTGRGGRGGRRDGKEMGGIVKRGRGR